MARAPGDMQTQAPEAAAQELWSSPARQQALLSGGRLSGTPTRSSPQPACVSIRQHRIRQQTPAYVRIRQHTSALPFARLTHRIPAVILAFVVSPPRLPSRARVAITRPGRQRRCRRRRGCRLRRRHLSWQSVSGLKLLVYGALNY
jgi:hypothetical protein